MSMFSTRSLLTVEEQQRLAAALNQTDAALAELEHVLRASQARGEAVLEESRRRQKSEASQ